MELTVFVTGFMVSVATDPRIGPRHISLYLAILHFYHVQKSRNPVRVFSRELRKQAKISSIRNYYSCMKDLREFGYIKYIPSFSPHEASEIYLVTIKSGE
jgi:hypothetical protein